MYPPLGAMGLATAARQAGHEAIICDLNIARRRGELPDSGAWHETAAEYILALEPEVVGFGTICSSFAATILIAKALKARSGSLPIIFGGPQATLVYRDLLANVPEVDFVLTGEADFTFTQFLDNLSLERRPRVPGLAQRDGGNIVMEPPGDAVDLDSLPMADYGLWPIGEAVQRGWYKGRIPIDAGRGCPYRCSFCSTSKYFGHKYRMKSSTRLKEEVSSLYKQYGFTSFRLSHDLFTVNRRDVVAIAQTLADSDVPGLSWTCSARVDTVDPELLRIMWEAGCRALFFGIECGSPRMQRIINKSLNLDLVEPIFLRALELGFHLTASWIVGFPQEEWRDIEATVGLLLRWSGVDNLRTQLHLLAPQPGTSIIEKYGDRLEFDAWFADRSFFNRRCPEPEVRFAREHPELCVQCFFIQSDRVDRKELVEIREFTDLLTGVLPGIGPFLQRTEASPVDLINRWRRRSAQAGLPTPNETGFFSFREDGGISYVPALLDELRAAPHLTETHQSFLSFWETILDLKIDSAPRPAAQASKPAPGSEEIRPGQELVPIITRKCALRSLGHDILRCLRDWTHRGVWNWPVQRRVHYLFVVDQEHLQISEVWPVTAKVFPRCDGKHTLAEVYSLVEGLHDPQTERLKQSMGTASLTGQVLAGLREMAGLRLIVQNSRRGKVAGR